MAYRKKRQAMNELSSLLKIPGNQKCADCGAVGPRWASINLGIFLCIKCSGIHRSLGVQISQVRSVTLDSWPLQQVKKMKEIGNTRSNEYWEAKLPEGFHRPNNEQIFKLERFIRDKYQRKLYVGKIPKLQETSNKKSQSGYKKISKPKKQFRGSSDDDQDLGSTKSKKTKQTVKIIKPPKSTNKGSSSQTFKNKQQPLHEIDLIGMDFDQYQYQYQSQNQNQNFGFQQQNNQQQSQRRQNNQTQNQNNQQFQQQQQQQRQQQQFQTQQQQQQQQQQQMQQRNDDLIFLDVGTRLPQETGFNKNAIMSMFSQPNVKKQRYQLGLKGFQNIQNRNKFNQGRRMNTGFNTNPNMGFNSRFNSGLNIRSNGFGTFNNQSSFGKF
ncbi:adp-ribosylation factor gtpase-activating protein [Anaeramoeba flamelloides]|uniref:Adp-ribosylation factor gtpase-activating protein n=1 Tax=Anaeramoeba flamelloides TaxID=1746091 RepID=A0AAV8A4H3_9EUKA|nr:adp-ribosylation factor gtpase-activating protein [Anaeramoeba flamelloides]